MSKLFVLCGLASSGKSTIGKAINKFYNGNYISSDEIRAELSYYEDQSRNDEVFKIFHKRIRDSLNADVITIADATNITIKSRRQIIDIAKRIPNVEIVCVLMATPYLTCVERDKKRSRSVGKEVLEKQLKRFQIPFYEEGFDDIVVVKTMPQSYSTNGYLTDAIDKMVNFDQETPYHQHTLFAHSVGTAQKFAVNNVYLNLHDGALLHDLGKLVTKTFDDKGVAHYYNHENVGAYEYFIDRIYEEPYWYPEDILNNTFVVNYHMMPFNWKEPKTIEKYKKIFGEKKTEMLIYFNECDRSCS